MIATTASPHTAEIQIVETSAPVWFDLIQPKPTNVVAHQIIPRSQSSAITLETLSAHAEWLGIIEQRITSSVALQGYPRQTKAAWLEPNVARAALGFFRDNSSVLPGEPFISSSTSGDLIAEFTSGAGRMTCVISPKFVILFAAIGEDIIQRQFSVDSKKPATLRSEIEEVSRMLSASQNGQMEPRP